MKDCTITIDATGFGYTYLLQLDSMLADFLDDGDNAAAADTLHDWMMENARQFTDDARASRDELAADIFSSMAEAADEEILAPAPEEEPANEEEPEKIVLDADEYDGARLNAIICFCGYDARAINVYDPRTHAETVEVTGRDRDALLTAYAEDRTTEDFFIEAEVAAWRSNPANEDISAALEANARDTQNDPGNLYRAGVFAGLAEAAAWMIYGRGVCPDDINAITAAVYQAYGVAW